MHRDEDLPNMPFSQLNKRASIATGAFLVTISPVESHQGLTEIQRRCSIGASAGCGISVASHGIADHHAEVIQEGNEYFLVDMGSIGGTYVNNSRVLQHHLADGDLIRIGEAKFKFLTSESPELEYHERLLQRAVRDGLTGAYNKSFMLAFLHRELNRCNLHDRPLSVLMMDIDFFKSINDTHGHQAGDEVLREFASRITPLLDADDILARYGGEEFAVVMCENNLDDAFELGNRIASAIREEEFRTLKAAIPVTVSIGVAGITGLEAAGPSPAELIDEADRLLYQAKTSGRDRLVMGRRSLGIA